MRDARAIREWIERGTPFLAGMYNYRGIQFVKPARRAAVDKRISVLARAIQAGATVYDLEEAERCYAPQFGSAKDAVNIPLG